MSHAKARTFLARVMSSRLRRACGASCPAITSCSVSEGGWGYRPRKQGAEDNPLLVVGVYNKEMAYAHYPRTPDTSWAARAYTSGAVDPSLGQAMSFPSLLQLKLRIEVPLWRNVAEAKHPSGLLVASSELSSAVFAQWPSLSLLAPISALSLMALTAGHKWKLSCVCGYRLPNFLMLSYCRWRINAPFFSSQGMELPRPLLPRSKRDYRQVVTLAPCRERRPPRTGRQPAVPSQRGLLQERQCVLPSTLPKWTQLMRSSLQCSRKLRVSLTLLR